MRSGELANLIWGDAVSLLEQAERLHRQFFRANAAADHCWEPPVDIVETGDELIVHVALPGVAAEALLVTAESGALIVAGVRPFPATQSSRIHRVEIPYGRFQRRIPLPMEAFQLARRQLVDGCLVLTFTKAKEKT